MFSGIEIVVVGLTLLVAAGIAVICIRWMQSTRASQRRVDEQNERIIALLERIAEQGSKDRA